MVDNITADDIASYFITFSNSVGDYISNLKLQKLLYYSQAWYLGIKKKQLFQDDFEAWVHGPVIRRIYGNYKCYGYNPIVLDKDEGEVETEILNFKKSFGNELTSFLQSIIDEYFGLSAWTLEKLVHQEAPWIFAREGLDDYEPSTNIISKKSMMDYYTKLAQGK
jgi:uncharacterized phage-associated protein